MAQRFRLSTAAKTVSLSDVMKATDAQLRSCSPRELALPELLTRFLVRLFVMA